MMRPRVVSGRSASLALVTIVVVALSSSLKTADGFAIGVRFNDTECFHKEISHERAVAASAHDGGAPDEDPSDLPFTVVGAYVVSKDREHLDAETSKDWNLPKVEARTLPFSSLASHHTAPFSHHITDTRSKAL